MKQKFLFDIGDEGGGLGRLEQGGWERGRGGVCHHWKKATCTMQATINDQKITNEKLVQSDNGTGHNDE